MPTKWSLYHRFVEPNCQGNGLGTICLKLMEAIITRSAKPKILLDPVESGIRVPYLNVGQRGATGIQVDVMEFALHHGFKPERQEDAQMIERVRREVDFIFVNDPHSGPKAVPHFSGDSLELLLVKDCRK